MAGSATGRGDRRRWYGRVGAGVAAGAVLLTACATMPDSGEVRRVDSPPEAESAVRVFGVSPAKGAQPPQIVWGFLEATTSDEARFATARKYLTGEARRTWDPFAGTTVLSGGPTISRQRSSADQAGEGYTVEVSGERMGRVDSSLTFSPGTGRHQSTFHLTREDGEWRIDSLPDGLLLGEADFQRIYRSVNRYYYAAYGPESADVPGGHQVLVADPIYLRRRIDPVTDIVRALVGGPSSWLDPVVGSAFPEKTRLARGQRLALDDSGALKVRLSGTAEVRADAALCRRMATQVLHTVQDQGSAKVNRVEIAGRKGARLCEQTRQDAESAAPGRLDGQASQQYFIDGEHRLVSLDEEESRAAPVAGPLGAVEAELSAVAVSRDEQDAAALSADRRALYVAPLFLGEQLEEPVLTSAGDGKAGLTAPSWDGLGDLWVADRGAADGPGLLRLRGGHGEPEQVSVPGLAEEEQIAALRVASDGVRIAMLVERDGHRTLELGRIERRKTPDGSRVSVESLRPVAPQLEEVVAMSWAGSSRLVVVGRESGGVQQLQYIETDGSTAHIPPLPGINDVSGVAAAENERKPVLADSAEGIVRLQPDTNWRKLTDDGMAPVYPG